MKPSKSTRDLIAKVRARRDHNGVAKIQNKEVASLIRDRLRRAFPGVAFSVRSGRGDSVDITWTDGPTQLAVEAITDHYAFGGFDGMIDMAYYGCNWLHPDGRMSHAATGGTEGSRGSVPSSATDCPEPGAFLVEYGPKYVFAQRTISDEHWNQIIRGASVYYGFEFNTRTDRWNQTHDGQFVTTLALRWEAMTPAEPVTA